jgi:hypothetical protein
VRPLFLPIAATTMLLASSAARGDEAAEAERLVPLSEKPSAGFTAFGPRPLDTILLFLRQASVEYPVAGVRDRLKDITDRLDSDKAVARMVESTVPDRQHPFARVVVDPGGTPALEFSAASWTASARECVASGAVEDLKDLTIAATLHAWGHLTLLHRVTGKLGQETISRQESEVWQDMMVNVLAPGRKEHRFLFSEKEDRETYYGLLCFAAADSRLDDPAWEAFLGWVTLPKMSAGVAVCRDIERRKSTRL